MDFDSPTSILLWTVELKKKNSSINLDLTRIYYSHFFIFSIFFNGFYFED